MHKRRYRRILPRKEQPVFYPQVSEIFPIFGQFLAAYNEKMQPPPPAKEKMDASYRAKAGGCKKGLAGFWNIWLFKGNSHTGVLYA